MKSGRSVNKGLVIAAVAIIGAFLLGMYANTQLRAGNGGSNTYNVADNYPYGECVGSCQHGFTFGADVVSITVTHLGQVVYQASYHNLITNAGEDVISRQTACGATGAPACANGGVFIALSTDAGAPVATDTVCPSESVVSGLARALGTYAHVAGTNTHTISHTFTLGTAGAVVIAKVCMFDAGAAGNLFAETLLASTATVNAVGDQITITWTFTH